MRQFADAQTHAGKDVVETQSAGADHFRERGRIGAVRASLVGAHRPRCSVKRHCQARRRVDQREPAGQRLVALRESVLPRGVENDDLYATGKRGERLHKVGNPDRLQRNVDIALNCGIDRNKIIVAGELHAKA